MSLDMNNLQDKCVSCKDSDQPRYPHSMIRVSVCAQWVASSQAKGTQSTSFLTCVRNEVDLEPLACKDEWVAEDCGQQRL